MEKIFHKSSLKGTGVSQKSRVLNSKNTQHHLAFVKAFRKGEIDLRFTGQTPALCGRCYGRISAEGADAGVRKWAVQNDVPVKPAGSITEHGELIILAFDRKWAKWENLSNFRCGFPWCSLRATYRFQVEDFWKELPNGGYEYLIIHHSSSIFDWMNSDDRKVKVMGFFGLPKGGR